MQSLFYHMLQSITTPALAQLGTVAISRAAQMSHAKTVWLVYMAFHSSDEAISITLHTDK